MADPPDDPFDGLELDEDFVRGASRREEAAEERLARLQRIDREHRQLKVDADAERAHARRRRARRLRRPQSSRGWITVAVVMVVIGIGVYANVFHHSSSGDGLSLWSSPSDGASGQVSLAGGQPSPTKEEARDPLGEPAELAGDSQPYTFIATQPADPSVAVAYDPCRPIHLVVSSRTALPDAEALLDDALRQVSVATGLQFIKDGPTDEAPSLTRAAFDPDRYGDRWVPVLVAWTDPAEIPDLAGAVGGVGGSNELVTPRGAVFLTGQVALDGPDLAAVRARPDGYAEVRTLIMHELGHLVGLDHVQDASQVMNPVGSPDTTDWGAGDRTGLAKLGRGACFPEL